MTETYVPPQQLLVAGPPEYLEDNSSSYMSHNSPSSSACMRYPYHHPLSSPPPEGQYRQQDSRRSSTPGYWNHHHHPHYNAPPPYLQSQRDEGVSVYGAGAAYSEKVKSKLRISATLEKKKKVVPKKRQWQSPVERNRDLSYSKFRTEAASLSSSSSTSNYSTEGSGIRSTQMFERKREFSGASSLPVDSSQKRKLSSSAPHFSGGGAYSELAVMSSKNQPRTYSNVRQENYNKLPGQRINRVQSCSSGPAAFDRVVEKEDDDEDEILTVASPTFLTGQLLMGDLDPTPHKKQSKLYM